MLTKTNIRNAKKFCCEDISKIENYEKALNDSELYDCHHKLEIELNKSQKELKEMGLYFNRPANELIFLTQSEHIRLHRKFMSKKERDKRSKAAHKRYESQEERDKQSTRLKGKAKKKCLWLTPDGETKTMDINHAKRYHPDWTLIGEA